MASPELLREMCLHCFKKPARHLDLNDEYDRSWLYFCSTMCATSFGCREVLREGALKWCEGCKGWIDDDGLQQDGDTHCSHDGIAPPGRPTCYRCEKRPARRVSIILSDVGATDLFCGTRCGASWGIGAANDFYWCPICRNWADFVDGEHVHGVGVCDHIDVRESAPRRVITINPELLGLLMRRGVPPC